MKYTIVSGSTRKISQSFKVSQYVKHILETQLNSEFFLLNLADANLKFWDESFWKKDTEFDPNWTKAKKEIKESDAIIIVAPEWNGMIPPALKNFFHLAVNGELANKPGLIISVSAAQNGVYPVCELRLNSYKNTNFCYIPQHVIVRNVNNVLNSVSGFDNEEDQLIKQRINSSLKILAEYGKAFLAIRASDAVKSFPYSYGM